MLVFDCVLWMMLCCGLVCMGVVGGVGVGVGVVKVLGWFCFVFLNVVRLGLMGCVVGVFFVVLFVLWIFVFVVVVVLRLVFVLLMMLFMLVGFLGWGMLGLFMGCVFYWKCVL